MKLKKICLSILFALILTGCTTTNYYTGKPQPRWDFGGTLIGEQLGDAILAHT